MIADAPIIQYDERMATDKTPDRSAFESFAASLGVALVWTRSSCPAFFAETEQTPPTLLVPQTYTPEQQGRLGADLARMVLTVPREREVA